MKKFDLGRALNTLSNIGVIAGLVFLGVEVGQNQAALEQANTINRQATLATGLNSYNSWRTLLIKDEELMRIWDESFNETELGDQDRGRFALLTDNLLWTTVASYEGMKAFGDDSGARGAVSLWRDFLDFPTYRRYWEKRGRPMIEEWGYGDFVRKVDEVTTQP
jgi:hypothetical protein